MGVQITVPAESTGLTTTAAVKAALGVASTRFDPDLERLILAATSAIEAYCGHTFAKQTYLEDVAGSNHPMLMLTNTPIVSVTSIVCDSEPVTDFEISDAGAGVLYREVGWAAKAWVGWGTEAFVVPGTEVLNFHVTYEAGFVTPGLTDDDLPKHIEQACLETVVSWYRSQNRDPAVESKKVGDLAITYKTGDSLPTAETLGIPPSARAMLSRRVR